MEAEYEYWIVGEHEIPAHLPVNVQANVAIGVDIVVVREVATDTFWVMSRSAFDDEFERLA